LEHKRKDGPGYCHCPIRRIRARPLQATPKLDIWGEMCLRSNYFDEIGACMKPDFHFRILASLINP